MAIKLGEGRLIPGADRVEYQGAQIDTDAARGFVIMKLSAFRSNVRARDAFDFFLEIYEEQALRKVALDLREAYWPIRLDGLEQRFLEHARRVPHSRIAVLCQEPEHEVMIAHRDANIAAGHTVLYTNDEAEARAFIEET